MKRPHDAPWTEPDADGRSPWLEAAIRAHDPNAFLMSLGATEFAVLLAELDARRFAGLATGTPGRHRRRGGGTKTRARGERRPPVLGLTRPGISAWRSGD